SEKKVAKIQIPYQPPEEYDLRITFTRLQGDDTVLQVLSKSGTSFVWGMGYRKNSRCCFSTIAGKTGSDDNPTIAKRDVWLENNRQHTSVISVRNDGLKAYLDGELIAQWKTDYRDMGIMDQWKLRNPTLLGLASGRNRIVFHRIEVREVTGKGTFTRGAPAGQTPSATPVAGGDWQNAINLLPLIDPAQDATSGKWEAAPDGLKATDIKSMSQKIQPPYRPPEEYDYRVSFTPISGNADVAIGLTAKGRSFVFYMKKYAKDHCLGFEAISGKNIAGGPTAHRFPHLEMGSRYTVVVEVRKNGLRGYLDGKLVAEWATDYSDMTAWPVWRFKDDTLPGFGCSVSTVVFQEVKLREVGGKGTFTRTPPPSSTTPQK
ncbi:MAG: hypothetical protein NTY01_21490, partial [Verrucomicrobia bacterium]|nr:hypothetical protein [Verrucomicrobiota bacterium]